MADDVVDLRLIGQQLLQLRAEFRMTLSRFEAHQNEQDRNIRLLLTMTQNLDEAVKDLNQQFGVLIGAVNTRIGALEDRT